MNAILRFRVRCTKEVCPFFMVHIFPTRDMMHAWSAVQNPTRPNEYRGVEAGVHAFRRLQWRGRQWKTSPQMGWIVFHSKHLGAGIVSHEMTHAAMYYLQLWRPQLFRRLQSSKKADEALAWVQGWLVMQFWRKFFHATDSKRNNKSQ